MAIRFTNSDVSDNGVGIRASSDVDIHFESSRAERNRIAFDIFEPITLARIGLPADAPPDLVRDVIEQLLKSRDATLAQKTEIVKKSRLSEWLAGAGSITAIAKNLIDIAAIGS